MSLEKIVDIAYKATLPIRIVDEGIKLSHDAIVAISGIDRFKLARYAAIGAGLSFLASSLGWSMLGSEGLVTIRVVITANLGAQSLLFSYSTIPQIENYFKKPKDILDEKQEARLAVTRFFRIAFASAAIVPAAVLELYGGGGTAAKILTTAGLIGVSSSFYFIDADHTLWDTAKDKVKQAYHLVSNLVPHRSPLPNPGHAISYETVPVSR